MLYAYTKHFYQNWSEHSEQLNIPQQSVWADIIKSSLFFLEKKDRILNACIC